MRHVTLAFLLLAFLLLQGCAPSEKGSLPTTEAKILKGITLSPQSFQAGDFTAFFEKAQMAGSVISWSGDWMELEKVNGGPTVIMELADKYHYRPLIAVQFFEQKNGRLLRTLDSATKQRYLDSAVAFTKKHRPPYLALGIEVNVLYEKSPEDFAQFASLYNEAYTAIKAVSPQTKVFTIFQLEKMKGLSGGLFGGKNDPQKAQWPILKSFSHLDLLAFTTYPGLIYRSPGDIPPDYYSEIKAYAASPLAFTEIGWHSAASPTGWESSEREQSEFVAFFSRKSAELTPEISIWSFLYDQKTIEPFCSMGLFDSEGKEKLAWKEWQKQ
jgi:hypothetical protein